jgi:hypothetical protein
MSIPSLLVSDSRKSQWSPHRARAGQEADPIYNPRNSELSYHLCQQKMQRSEKSHWSPEFQEAFMLNTTVNRAAAWGAISPVPLYCLLLQLYLKPMSHCLLTSVYNEILLANPED